MKPKKKKTAGELVKMAGREDWNGINPVTRVIPNKKKAKPIRKAKHKGRHESADPFFMPITKAA